MDSIAIVFFLSCLCCLASSSPFLPVTGDGEGNSGTSSGLAGLWHVFRQAVTGRETTTRILQQQQRQQEMDLAAPGTSFTIISRMKSIEPLGSGDAVKKVPRPAWTGIAGRRDDSAEDESLRLNKKAENGDGFFVISNGLLQFREGGSPTPEPIGSNGRRTVAHFVSKPQSIEKQRRPQKWASTTTTTSTIPPPLPSVIVEENLTMDNNSVLVSSTEAASSTSRKPIDLSSITDNRIDGSTTLKSPPPPPTAFMAVKVNETMRYAATYSFNNGTVVFERSLARDSIKPPAASSASYWRELSEVEKFYPGFSQAAGNNPLRLIIHNRILTSSDEEEVGERPVTKRPPLSAADSGVITSRPRPVGGAVTVELAKPLVVTDVPSNPTEEQMSPPMSLLNENSNKTSSWLVQLNDNATESNNQPIGDWQAAGQLMQPPKLYSGLHSMSSTTTAASAEWKPLSWTTTSARLSGSTDPPLARVTPDNAFSSIFKKWASNLASSSTSTTTTTEKAIVLNRESDVDLTTAPSVVIGKWTVVTSSRNSNTTKSPLPVTVPDSLAAVFKKWSATLSPSESSSPWSNQELPTTTKTSSTTLSSSSIPIKSTRTTTVVPPPPMTTSAAATFMPFHSVSVLLPAKPDASSKANSRRRPIPASSNKMASLILAHTSALMSGKKPQPVALQSASSSTDLEASPRSRQQIEGKEQAPAIHVIVATAIPSDDFRYRSLQNGLGSGGEISRTSTNNSNVSSLWDWPFASSFLDHPAEETPRDEESFDPVDANATPISSLTLQRRRGVNQSDDGQDDAAGNLPLFPRFTCDRETVNETEMVLTNPNYPAADVSPGRCSFRLKVTSPTICQVRVEFRDSRMLLPRSGSCQDQYLIASGAVLPHPSASIRDKFCGWNDDQHFYLELTAPNGTQKRHVNLHLDTLQAGFPYRYAIIVQQIDCSPLRPNPLKAPSGCFQYWNSGRTGVIKSFNYDGGRYWSNQSYRICIRSADNACTLALSSVDSSDFNLHRSGTRSLSGVGHTSCPRDYLWIPGTVETLSSPSKTGQELDDRYCGAKLSDLDGEVVPGVVIARMHSDVHVIEFRTGQSDPTESETIDNGGGGGGGDDRSEGFRISFTQMSECPTTPSMISP